MKLYEVPEEEVIERASCTWCGAAVGEPCRTGVRTHYMPQRYNGDLPGGPGTAHAQRWRDYWNATHDPREGLPVQRRG